MKLVVAIVPERRANILVAALLKNGLRVTGMTGAGGFLRRRNVTLLIGAEEDEVEWIAGIATRIYRPAGATHRRSTETGGATLFVLDLQRMVQVNTTGGS